jgi:hypothetical protein
MSEAKGIKEILEVLDGVKVLLVNGKKVMADGKVSLADLPVAMELLKQMSVLNAAVQGASEVVAEAKDISGPEVDELVAKVLEVFAAVKAA